MNPLTLLLVQELIKADLYACNVDALLTVPTYGKIKQFCLDVCIAESDFTCAHPSPVKYVLARYSAPVHTVAWSTFHRYLVAASGAFQGIHVRRSCILVTLRHVSVVKKNRMFLGL